MVDDESLPDDESSDDSEASEPAAAPAAPDQTLASVAQGDNQPMAPGSSPLAEAPPMNQTVLQYLQAQQAKMAQAQQQSSQDQFGVGLARAGATLGTALAGAKPADESAFDHLEEQAKSPVNDLMAKQKQMLGDAALKDKLDEEKATNDANDPDSDVSKQFRANFKAFYPKDAAAYGDHFDDLTAADAKDIKDFTKTNANIAEREQVAGMRRDQAKYALDSKTQLASDKRDLATNAMNEKDAADLGTLLDKGSASRSGAVGQLQQKINNAEATEALIEQAKAQKGGMDSRQVEELAESTARTLGGGAAASARVDALVPHSFWGNVQHAGEWLSNSPQGADMQAFTDRMAETVAREKAVAANQLKKYQVESLSGRERLRTNDPDRYNRMLSSRHITPDMINDQGQYQTPGKNASPPPDDQGDQHARAAAKLAQRQAARAQAAGQPPQPSQTPVPGFAYGGMVGGLPSSNFAAGQAMRPPHPPKLNLHSMRGYAEGGMIPGRASVPGNSPKNDTVPIMASPGEYVVPRHIMQGPAGRLIRKMCEGGMV